MPRQCSAPRSAPHHGGQHPWLCLCWPTAEPFFSPPPQTPQCPTAGECVATPHSSAVATRLLPQYQDRRSCWGTQWPQPPVQHPGLYTALHHVMHPLPNGLTPSRTCSLPSKHHRCVQPVLTPPRHPLAPATAAHCNTRTGPVPPNAPCGSSAVPLAMLPCCEHPPHHIPCKLGTCTMAGPCSPSWGTALGTWSTLIHCCGLLNGPWGASNTQI